MTSAGSFLLSFLSIWRALPAGNAQVGGSVLLLVLLAVPVKAQQERWATLLTSVRETSANGRYQEAAQLARSALEEAERFGRSNARVAVVLNDLGSVEHSLGNYADAERAFRRGIKLLEPSGAHRKVLLKLCSNLASLLTDLGIQLGYAESLRRRALAIAAEELSPRDPEVITLLANLGTTLIARGKHNEAWEQLETARALAEIHAERISLGGVLSNLGVVAEQTGRHEEAIRLFQDSILILDAALGPQHPGLIHPCLNLSRLYLKRDRAEAAWRMAERALQASVGSLPDNHPTTLDILRVGARAAAASGRKKEASALKERLRTPASPLGGAVGAHVDVTDLKAKGK